MRFLEMIPKTSSTGRLLGVLQDLIWKSLLDTVANK
jgi:hypothetical protein